MIHAGFDCRNGKYLCLIENSFIVSKDSDFDITERQQQGFQWTSKHHLRSPIQLKSSVVDMRTTLYNCKSIISQNTLAIPDNYKPHKIGITMNRWGLKFYT